jgi:glycosyltransferase involved in cell wall biosynthesis
MTAILLTCEDFLPAIGGAEICVENLANELQKLGYNVTIFTNTVEKLENELEKNIVRLPWKFTLYNVMNNVRTLWKLIHESNIVHCQYSFRIACLCAIICRLQGKPMVLTQQGRGIVPEAQTKWYYLFLYKICQHVSMRGAHVITSTSKEITELTAKFVDRTKIIDITNGFNGNLFKPSNEILRPKEFLNIKKDTKIILSVRRLVPKNGIHILIQALASLKKQYKEFHYFAIGTGRMYEEIQLLINSLNMQDCVTLLGSRSNHELKNYYQHANVIVVPSSAESTSIACIEAMAMGRPLVASKVGGLIDLIGRDNNNGTLVEIYESETSNYDAPETLPEKQLEPLVQILLDVFLNPDSYEKKALHAAKHAQENYSWEAITKQYIYLYNQLLLK